MKLSYQWLKELLPELRATPAVVAKRLTGLGIEVEEILRPSDGFLAVVVGDVRKLSPHPKADRLRVAIVFDGEAERTVVTGAPNIEKGQRVAFAPIGTTLPNGMTIESRALRGITSEGMLCSEQELGLVDASSGILLLAPRSKPGKKVADVLGAHDVIFHLGVTPNRADALSHLGIARELAAQYRLNLPSPKVRVREGKVRAADEAQVMIEAKDVCSDYRARVINGVDIGPSPDWVQRRLKTIGLRSISNVVDATNLVLFELGHPLHAFDLDRVQGAQIVVRRAKPDEATVLIDGVDRRLHEDDLIIADETKPVALAGVMGGQASEVNERTTRVLLESAVFAPSSVRRSAKRHGLHTEASHRFERGADPKMVEYALDRCSQLIVDLAGGEISSGVLSAQGKKIKAAAAVPIRPKRAALLLGRPVDRKEVRDSLVALGLKSVKDPGAKQPKRYKKNTLFFKSPSWRVDLSREEDLIEEVGRLAGYEQVVAAVPAPSAKVWSQGLPPDHDRILRRTLVAEGFSECISLAFHSRGHAEWMGFEPSQGVVLSNPLGEESRYLRMSMLPALLKATRQNQDNLPSETDLLLFEVGKTFVWSKPAGQLPIETRAVGILMRGQRFVPGWSSGKDSLDVFDLKAVVESLCHRFSVEGHSWTAADDVPWLHPRSATRLMVEGQTIGLFGEAHPDLLQSFGIVGAPVFVAELAFDVLVRFSHNRKRFHPLPKLPPAQRDLSFIVAEDVESEAALNLIRETGKAQLERIFLFDIYRGEGIPAGKKSLAVALTFRSPDKTLTDVEVDSAQSAIIEALQSRLSAEIRSDKTGAFQH